MTTIKKISDKDVQDYIIRFNYVRKYLPHEDMKNSSVRKLNSLLVEILSQLSTGKKQTIPLLLIDNKNK